EKIGNIFVHRIGRGNSSYASKILFIPRAASAARALHRAHHFDALWAMMSYMLFPIVLSKLRVPYLLTLQEGDPFKRMFARWFILPVLPLLWSGFERASTVTAISSYLAAWAKRMSYRGTPQVIPNGVDLARFTYSPHRGGGRLVTASRLVEKNGIDVIIRTLTHLPDASLLICGSGPREAELKRLAEDLKVAGRMEWYGHVEHTKLSDIYKTADIFVRPSRSEGMGNSFVEAMAAGLPVIATQEGGIADFLFDEKRNLDKEPTGWAVDKDSPGQIAAAVKDIVANPDKVARITQNAAKMVREKYDWVLIARAMKRVLDNLV
ncbi:hypothetical protein A3H77_00640, partial [Candidatus Kaiserbacteria bacterium RIFCSPLOWO2_02_FULL_56_11]